VGDFLRIGSVGLVVSEMHAGGQGEREVLCENDLQYLREDVGAIREDLFLHDEAITAAQEAELATPT